MSSGRSPTSPSSAFTPGQLASRPIYDGRIVNLSLDTVRFPNGTTGELEMIRHSGAAAVLPLLDPPDHPDPRILLVQQYRYAAGGPLLEVPAGRPDQPGEDWEVCARRELREETGYSAAAFRYLTAIYTTPGFTDELIHLFLAYDLEPGDTDHDEDEFIELVHLPLSEGVGMAVRGEITDAKTICTLLLGRELLRSGSLAESKKEGTPSH